MQGFGLAPLLQCMLTYYTEKLTQFKILLVIRLSSDCGLHLILFKGKEHTVTVFLLDICFGFECRPQAHCQKFAMGGCFGGLGAKPLTAGGHLDSGVKPPICRTLGGVRVEPPTLENLVTFYKNNLILDLF